MADILVVDDEPVNRMLVRAILTAHDVREADDAQSAIAQVRQAAPDLIILDVALPGVDGIELLKRLRRDEDCQSHILLYTATTPDETMRDIAALFSVRGFLPKPGDPRDTLRIVEEALA